MIAILSPAKTLDFDKPIPDAPATRPRFPEDAEALSKAAAKLSAKKLGALMHISPKLAKLNVERYRGFADAPERAALYAFMGDVYLGFAARGLGEPAIAFAQEHVRILSGLYGLLRPLDAIRPYRLEMGTRWAPGRKKDLYGWWGDRLGAALADDLASEGSNVVINLASQEYWAAIAQAPPKGARIVTIDFREAGPDGPRFVSFNAKRARGMMARFLCAERIADPDGLKDFAINGYKFDKPGSDEDRWQFLRG
ncbi:MAG: peroxide stress protein YaaA [Sphingomonadaceae bacterium]|nr:peroxide stress protein YaaA [Sphingomonadaceae bacterium]